MSDDFDIESLSTAWQAQNTPSKFTKEQIKKRLIRKRFGLFAVTTVELGIIFAVAWFLMMAFSESWAIHLKAGLIFALFIGVFTFILMSKSRFKGYQMMKNSTSKWIEFEESMSLEALQRGKYTKYLIAVFAGAVMTSFTYEYFYMKSPISELAWRYLFGTIWLTFVWLLNIKQIKKHNEFLSKLK
jgi:ABC-type dipeptide/oligopeptide/nickel transport system permease component